MSEDLPPPPATEPARPSGWGAPSHGPGLSGPRVPGPVGATGDVRTSGLLAFLGGALVVLGSFLPAVTFQGFGVSGSVSGTSAGWGVLLLGGFALAKGASVLWPATVRLRLGTPLITGGLLVVLLVMRWNDIHDAISQAQSLAGVTGSVGIGFWIDALGAAAVLAAGLLQLRAARSR
jgi:hypothetical protein